MPKPIPQVPTGPALTALAHALLGPFDSRTMSSHMRHHRSIVKVRSAFQITAELLPRYTGTAFLGLLGYDHLIKRKYPRRVTVLKWPSRELIRRPIEQMQLAVQHKPASSRVLIDAFATSLYLDAALLRPTGLNHFLPRTYIRRVSEHRTISAPLTTIPKEMVYSSSDSSSRSSNSSIDSTCECVSLSPSIESEARDDIAAIGDVPQTAVVPESKDDQRGGPRKIEFRPRMQLDSLTAGLDSPPRGFCKATESLVHSAAALTPEEPYNHYTLRKGDGRTRCSVGECSTSSGCKCYLQETFHSIFDPAIDGARSVNQGIPHEILSQIFVHVKGPVALVLQPQYNKIKILGQSLPMVTTIPILKRKAMHQAAMNGGDHHGILQELEDKVREEHLYQIDLSKYFRTAVQVFSTNPISVAKVDYRVEHLMEEHAELDLLDIQKHWQTYLPMVPAAQRHQWDLGKVIEEVRLFNVVQRPFDLFLARDGAKPRILETDAPYITISGFTQAPQSTEIINGKMFELGWGLDPIRFHAEVEYWDWDLLYLDINTYTPAQVKSGFEFKPQVGYRYPEETAPWGNISKGHASMQLPDGTVGTELVQDPVLDLVAQYKIRPNLFLLAKAGEYDAEVDVAHCNGLGSDCPHCMFYDLNECYCPQLGFALNSDKCDFCYESKQWQTNPKAASRIDRWIEAVEVERKNGRWMGMDGGMDIKLLRESAKDMKDFPQLGLSIYPGLAPEWKQQGSTVNPAPGYPPRHHPHLKIDFVPLSAPLDGFESRAKIAHAYVELKGPCWVRVQPVAGAVQLHADHWYAFEDPSEEVKGQCRFQIDLTVLGLNCVLHLSQQVDDLLLDFIIPELLDSKNVPYNTDAKVYARDHYREYEDTAPFASRFEQHLGELRLHSL